MLDGRQASLELQAGGAIHDHAEATVEPSLNQLELIRQFQLTDEFFSSPALRERANGGPGPRLPRGTTDAERRGRRFFEDVPPNPADFRPGLCAACHSGTLMNQTNEFASQFLGFPVRTGTRFQNILVSEFNDAAHPVREFIFNEGTPRERHVFSADPGRALVTGQVDGDVLAGDTTFEHTNAFKIPQLRDIRHTAPYFHDNSAKTLDDVALHYGRFFITVTRGRIRLTPQDMADIAAFLKLLD
jgi:cytochrome c peroxidase